MRYGTIIFSGYHLSYQRSEHQLLQDTLRTPQTENGGMRFYISAGGGMENRAGRGGIFAEKGYLARSKGKCGALWRCAMRRGYQDNVLSC